MNSGFLILFTPSRFNLSKSYDADVKNKSTKQPKLYNKATQIERSSPKSTSLMPFSLVAAQAKSPATADRPRTTEFQQQATTI